MAVWTYTEGSWYYLTKEYIMVKWTIYSKNNCLYCDKAKFKLKDELVEVKNIEEQKEWFTELLERVPTARTMPQIFRNGELIGGYDQLEKFLMQEQLSKTNL